MIKSRAWRDAWDDGTYRGTFYNLLKFGDSPTKSMLPYIKAVAAAGVRVWVFRSVDALALLAFHFISTCMRLLVFIG